MAISKMTEFSYLINATLKPVYVNVTQVEGIRQDKDNTGLWTIYMMGGDHFVTDTTNAMAIRDAVNAF
jgi:hypothetical protein